MLTISNQFQRVLLLAMIIFGTCRMQAQNTNTTTTTTDNSAPSSASKLALQQALGMAAKINVRGTVYDNANLQTLPGAQIKLMRNDSILVAATIANDNGQYLLREVASGTYRLNISMMGYKAQNFSINLPKKSGNFKVQDVLLKENAALMTEVEVVGKLPEMTVVDDTVVYNADAFKLPEGAVVEELIKRLPGIVIDDDGNYVFNGKKVSQFLVDGKEFFGNDRDMILKQLPAEIVKQVKAYDKKSDRARITGIDDGEERTVLDLIIKEDRKKGWFGNVEAGYGTHDRYSGRLNTNMFKGDQKFSVVGSGNNSNGNGTTDNQSAGFTMNYQKEKYELNGSITGNFSQGGNSSWTDSQNFELTTAKFSSSRSSNHNNNKGVNFQYRMEFRPDSSWNILVRPEFSYRHTSSGNQNESAQFERYGATGQNPFEINDSIYHADHVVDVWNLLERDFNIGINHRQSMSSNKNNNFSGSVSAQINKRLGKQGRNVTLNFNGSYGKSTSEGDNYSQTDYLQSVYQQLLLDGKPVYDDNHRPIYADEAITDSVYHKIQFNHNPNKNYSMQAQLGYSEPLGNDIYLQLNYSANFRYQDNQRNIQAIFDDVQRDAFGNKLYDLYRDLGINRDNFGNYYGSQYVREDTTQVGYTKNRNLNQNANIQIRMNRTKYQLTVGGSLQPQYSKTDNVRGRGADGQLGSRQNTHNQRMIVNASPSINFRYMFTRQETINFRYSGSTSQPSINDLVNGIISDTDPLNIRLGNPDLKPSYSQNINADYSRTKTETQTTNSINFQFRTTMNSTAQYTEYNEETGGRITKPINVNGNWSGSTSYTFNTQLGEKKRWRISNSLSGSFNNNIGFQYNSKQRETVRTRTNTLSSQDRFTLTYRYRTETEWDMEARGTANVRYNANRSTNPNAKNMDTWNFGYGLNFSVTTPWGMSLSTDCNENSRRGYSNASANTDKWIWNAQISQRLLKGKVLTLTLRAVDILNQRDDINRSVGATSSSDSHSQMISSYYMLTVNYRFNKFGGRSMRGRQTRNQFEAAPMERPAGAGAARGGMGGGGARGGAGGGNMGGGAGGGGRR